MLRFAMNAYGHFAANYCTRNIDNVLVGWFFGPQSLGFYKKAYDLCVLPVGQLSNPLHAVAIPTLSRLCADPEKQRRYILRALSTLAFIGMGLGAALALCGDDLILVLLGRQWAESGRILRFFGPGIEDSMRTSFAFRLSFLTRASNLSASDFELTCLI